MASPNSSNSSSILNIKSTEDLGDFVRKNSAEIGKYLLSNADDNLFPHIAEIQVQLVAAQNKLKEIESATAELKTKAKDDNYSHRMRNLTDSAAEAKKIISNVRGDLGKLPYKLAVKKFLAAKNIDDDNLAERMATAYQNHIEAKKILTMAEQQRATKPSPKAKASIDEMKDFFDKVLPKAKKTMDPAQIKARAKKIIAKTTKSAKLNERKPTTTQQKSDVTTAIYKGFTAKAKKLKTTITSNLRPKRK